MKKLSFIMGIIIGGILFGGIYAASDGIIATLSEQDIYVNDKRVDMEMYSIEGNNYVRLRDIGQAVDFDVVYDELTDNVYVNGKMPYDGKDKKDRHSEHMYLYESFAKADRQSDLYLQAFLDMYDVSELQSEAKKYIGLDLSKVKYKNKQEIVKQFNNFCEKNNIKLLLNTYNELREYGYINVHEFVAECTRCGGGILHTHSVQDVVFDEGILIEFKDFEISDTLIKTEARTFEASLGGARARYMIEKKDDETWTLYVTTARSIS